MPFDPCESSSVAETTQKFNTVDLFPAQTCSRYATPLENQDCSTGISDDVLSEIVFGEIVANHDIFGLLADRKIAARFVTI